MAEKGILMVIVKMAAQYRAAIFINKLSRPYIDLHKNNNLFNEYLELFLILCSLLDYRSTSTLS